MVKPIKLGDWSYTHCNTWRSVLVLHGYIVQVGGGYASVKEVKKQSNFQDGRVTLQQLA